MDWMDPAWLTGGATPDIDAASAAVIASGMKAVALADGVMHHRELALISAFEADLPAAESGAVLAAGADVRHAYLQSLIFVALADGRISDEELAVIRELTAANGFAPGAVDDEILASKRRFLGVFAGVTVFREAVVDVARELGISLDEIEDLQPGH